MVTKKKWQVWEQNKWKKKDTIQKNYSYEKACWRNREKHPKQKEALQVTSPGRGVGAVLLIWQEENKKEESWEKKNYVKICKMK